MKRDIINDLYEQSYRIYEVPYEASVVDPTVVAVSKQKVWDRDLFAELIVARMLDIVEAHSEIFDTERDRLLIKHIKQAVKIDFGVEE